MVLNLIWKIQIFLFLTFTLNIKKHFQELNQLQTENYKIYNKLKNIAENDDFSKIKLIFTNECLRSIPKCSMTGCKVQNMEFHGRSGVIDLLKYPESYSPEAYKTGFEVWKDINKIINGNNLLENLVSGLRFSINIHIAAFYKRKKNNNFISNSWLFKRKMYNINYENNFLILYKLSRKAITMLGNKEEISDNINNLKQEIIQNIGNKINTNIKVEISNIELIERMINALGCLNCQKCMLWGTIQLKGLKAIVKIINDIKLTKMDKICLINSFRRLSVSLKKLKQFEKSSLINLEVIYIYWYKICFILIILSIILTIILHSRQFKFILIKNKSIKNCI